MVELLERLSRCLNIEPCTVSPALGRWLLAITSQTNTTGVHLHSNLEFTIMEIPSLRYFSLPTPGSRGIFISGLRTAVPWRPTGPAGPILHPAMCLLRREDHNSQPQQSKEQPLSFKKLVFGGAFLAQGLHLKSHQRLL